VAVHDISQRVNHKHGFQTTAVMLAAFPITRYRQLVESFPEDMSAVVEFLILEPQPPHEVYLPQKYRRILRTLYGRLGIDIEELHPTRFEPAPRTRLDVDIAYHNNNAVIVVQRFGSDFDSSLLQTASSLRGRGINAIYVDVPLGNPCADSGVHALEKHGFLFSGLLPLYHGECDYLRMQSIGPDLDFDLIATYSPMADEIKKRIESEIRWSTRKLETT
jgi:serine/threonine-protein kinase RsbW